MHHSYGWKPDQKDERDFLFKGVQKVEQLPPSVDLRTYCSKVRDQGNLGSCTGFAIVTGLREFMERKNFHLVARIERLLSTRYYILSPLFLYYWERVLENSEMEDSGAEIRDGMKVLEKTGVCREFKDPYIVNNFTKSPSKYALKNALSYKITVYSRINSLNDIKSALAGKQGVVFGFNVYESFEADIVAKTGQMPMPEQGEQILGGHAVFVCGYRDDNAWAGGGYLIIKNSWGVGWGDKGFFYMPYAFAKSENVSDIWTATK